MPARFVASLALVATLLPGVAPAADEAAVKQAIAKASAFLANCQDEEGSFKADLGPAVTGLAVTAPVNPPRRVAVTTLSSRTSSTKRR